MIIENLCLKSCWEDFLKYKRSGGHLSPKELSDLSDYILNEKYTAVVQRIVCGGSFSLPEVSFVNKGFSGKKRTVFTFPADENCVQKMISFLLQSYDGIFPPNLYSFRRDTGVKKAVSDLKGVRNLDEMYSFKLDISDYFNSVDCRKLISILKQELPDERDFTELAEKTLSEPYAVKDGRKIEIKKGIMAGSPMSAFFANLYLVSLDRYFHEAGAVYARYSDDIIVFAETQEKLAEYEEKILSVLSDYGLSVNEDKVQRTSPHEEWTFLGFRFKDGTVDISDVAAKKIKAKMKRKANALIRWKHRKNAEPERAARAFINCFNKKFFDNPLNNEITWCRWFFPIINTEESLREIDSYMQDCIRYIVTEKHTKARFNFRYEEMKRLGYISLVSCFWEYRKTGEYAAMRRNDTIN